MALKIKSTKIYKNLPCGHAQFFDKEPDGSPGDCSSIHGYDRSVEFRFAGEVDEMGWMVPFGELKEIKVFLEYYFDHVTVLPANDPRLNLLTDELTAVGSLLGTLRILPSGVSMEMSAVFIWEHVNHYIYKITNGRCYVECVRVYEHDRNDAMVEVDEDTARADATRKESHTELLPMKSRWDWESPAALVSRIRQHSKGA
jgi:6-pyruvoyl-tetrahydropterin synthase